MMRSEFNFDVWSKYSQVAIEFFFNFKSYIQVITNGKYMGCMQRRKDHHVCTGSSATSYLCVAELTHTNSGAHSIANLIPSIHTIASASKDDTCTME
jgi:hypothetical protein